MILADTSVWIDYLNKRDPLFDRVLAEQLVLLHPFVIGELSLGNLKNRKVQLEHLAFMPQVGEATDQEVMALIENAGLYGAGIGYVDAHLLASAKINGVDLWTRDKRLHQAAVKLGLSRLH
jgi:predicted nucleic acid-binding protein